MFDVFRDNISIYMPLPRLLAGTTFYTYVSVFCHMREIQCGLLASTVALFTGASRHNLTMDQLLEVPSDVSMISLTTLIFCTHTTYIRSTIPSGCNYSYSYWLLCVYDNV